MGIQINGNTDIISATDGSLAIQGADLGSASASSLNISGIVTASGFSGNVTGNISASGVSTFSGGINVGTGASISSPSTNVLTLGTNNSERVRIDSSGLVGIGSNSPTAPLNVVNNNANTPTVWLRNTSGGGDSPVLRVQGGANNDNAVGTFEVRDYDGNVDFKVGGTGNITIGNGNLVFSTAGKGIDFSATANSSGTMTSELLNDYEEGTWTPTIAGSTSTVSYTTQYGVYTKVGRIVYCSIAIRASSIVGTNTVVLNGLPFSSNDTSDITQRSTWRLSNGGHISGLSDATGRFRINGSSMQGVKGDTTTTFMTCAQLTSGSVELTGDFWYFTAT